jgi:anaerobic magnesium-protoporphyrin IX monomethyl ester cyclase
MKVSLTYYRGDDFYRLLPPDLMDSRYSEGRVQVMAFPPTGIETLAPIISQRGHEVRMFDTFHPLMEKEHIAQAARTEKPDVIALSFFRRLPTPSPATWRVGLTDILGHACDNRWCFRDY